MYPFNRLQDISLPALPAGTAAQPATRGEGVWGGKGGFGRYAVHEHASSSKVHGAARGKRKTYSENVPLKLLKSSKVNL